MQTSDEQFQAIINDALASLEGEHAASIANVAILWEEEPTAEQRQELALGARQTLLGLYQGIPLPERQGTTPLLPDRITIFKRPHEQMTASLAELQEEVRHTLWHEIGHYYGLNHDRIHELER